MPPHGSVNRSMPTWASWPHGDTAAWCVHAYACTHVESFPTINLCARTPHCTAHSCICIADQAMIRDHRSWLLWETRRKVITDKTYPAAHPWYLRCHTRIARVFASVLESTRGGCTMHAALIANSMRSCNILVRIVSLPVNTTIKVSLIVCNFFQHYLILLLRYSLR